MEVNLKQTINLDLQMSTLRNKSKIFLELSPNLSWSDIFIRYKDNLSKMEFGDDNWDSREHMNLKNLTRTKVLQMFRFLPDMLSYQLSELYQANQLSAKFIEVMNAFVKACKNRIPTRESFRTVFKQLSIDVKKNLDNVGEDWMFLTDLDLLLGYNLSKPLDTEDKARITRDWAKGDVSRGLQTEKYYVSYRKAVRNRLTNMELSKLRPISLRNFVMQIDNWMTDGSSRGVRLPMMNTVTNRRVKSRAKKQTIALQLSVDDLTAQVRVPFTSDESYSVSEKIEPGLKFRCIISAPYAQQIRLGFCEYFMGTNLKHCFPDIYFLQSQKTQEVICDNLVNFSKVNMKMLKYLFFPLDASAFDQNVSRQEITIIFEELHLKLRAIDPSLLVVSTDLLEILELAGRMWFESPIIIDKVLNLGKWEHGVPSGVRWTALIDSIVNACRFDVCKEWLGEDEEFGIPIVHYQMFQGDDMALVLGRPIDTIRILKFYEIANIPVHPLKNFLSTKGNEFLRKIYYKGRQRGYPNRMVTKFMYRLPEKRGAANNANLMRERTTTLINWCARHGNLTYTINKLLSMYIKVYGSMSLSNLEIILTTSSVNGGFGWILPDGYRIKSVRAKDDVVYHVDWIEKERTHQVSTSITGAYHEQLTMLENAVGAQLPTGSLLNSLVSALDPSKNSDWSGRIKISKTHNVKLTFGISLKVNIQSQLNTEFRPWMVSREWNYPSTKDVITYHKRNNDRAAVVAMTDVSLRYIATILMEKADDAVFWGWVQSTAPTPSFNMLNLNDLQRSRISKQVYQTYMSRLIRYKLRIREFDVIDVCNLIHNYVSKNMHYFVKQGYVLQMSD